MMVVEARSFMGLGKRKPENAYKYAGEIARWVSRRSGVKLTARDFTQWVDGGKKHQEFDNAVQIALGDRLYASIEAENQISPGVFQRVLEVMTLYDLDINPIWSDWQSVLEQAYIVEGHRRYTAVARVTRKIGRLTAKANKSPKEVYSLKRLLTKLEKLKEED